MILPLMSYTPTPEDRDVLPLARVAIEQKLGLLMKQAAGCIGVKSEYLVDCFAFLRPLKFTHLFRIPGFRRAFMHVLAEAEGCIVLDQRLFEAEQVKRSMAKAELPPVAKKEIA